MSIFDDADLQTSRAVSALLDQPVVWRPMRARPHNQYTNEESEEDPERPARGEDRDIDPLDAIVTWRPTQAPVGQSSSEGNLVVMADCLVDFDQDSFIDEDGRIEVPRQGDYFELTEAYQGQDLVEVTGLGDDGSRRIYFFCRPVT